MVVYSEREVELIIDRYRVELRALADERDWWKVVAHIAANRTPNKCVEVRSDLGEFLRGKAEFHVGYETATGTVIYKPKPVETD
jgi:hypothetical protein